MRKILVLLILGIFAAIFTMNAFADDGCCRKMGMGGQMHEKSMGSMHGQANKGLEEKFLQKAKFILQNSDELGLSEEQVQKIKALKRNTKKSLIKNEAEIKLLALDIEAALEKDQIDVNAVNELLDKKYGVKGQIAKVSLAAYAELKGILNKEQVKRLREIWKQKSADKCMFKQAGEDGHKMGMQKKM